MAAWSDSKIEPIRTESFSTIIYLLFINYLRKRPIPNLHVTLSRKSRILVRNSFHISFRRNRKVFPTFSTKCWIISSFSSQVGFPILIRNKIQTSPLSYLPVHLESWVWHFKLKVWPEICMYRVSEGKVFFLIWLWEIEIYKLDYIWR